MKTLRIAGLWLGCQLNSKMQIRPLLLVTAAVTISVMMVVAAMAMVVVDDLFYLI
jgi:hypothetical protein